MNGHIGRGIEIRSTISQNNTMFDADTVQRAVCDGLMAFCRCKRSEFERVSRPGGIDEKCCSREEF